MKRYKVRFAPVKPRPSCREQLKCLEPDPKSTPKKYRKSRYGCRECKQDRLKCDETYPVCLRCSRRGVVCHAAAREQQWQIQLPGWMAYPGRKTNTPHQTSDHQLDILEKDYLLKYWLHTASRILVYSEDNNPFAYPIVEHLSISQSLVHAINSISSAHRQFFHSEHLRESYEERIKAMEMLREELNIGSIPMHTLFLTIYLLGISSSFLDDKLQDFGHEHLEAARKLVDLILIDEKPRRHRMTASIVGVFVYWDMSCSLLSDPHSTPLDSFETGIWKYIKDNMYAQSHPVNGPCTDLFFVLSVLGRYLRQTAASGCRHFALEARLETELLQWTCPESQLEWLHIAEAFRKHGLIMLYRCCSALDESFSGRCVPAVYQNTNKSIDPIIRQYTLDIITCLSHIPMTSNFLLLQGIPLLTAGAELTVGDESLQNEVKSRLLALYSFSRIPANLEAVHLLDKIWRPREDGDKFTWSQIMFFGMKLRLG